jgi:hypothetical protein
MKEFLVVVDSIMAVFCFLGFSISCLSSNYEDLKESAMIIYLVWAAAFLINAVGISSL